MPEILQRCRGCHRDFPMDRYSTYDNGQGLRYRRKCRDCRNDYQREIRANGNKAPERPPITEKPCCDCKVVKPLEDFAMQRKASGNWTRGSVCRPCRCRRCKEWLKRPGNKDRQKDAGLKRRYGLSLTEYSALLESQGGVCAICRKLPVNNIDPRNGKPRQLAVDHSHRPDGKVRGLLCAACNRAIGNLQDDPALLRAAADYIERYNVTPS